MPYWMLMWKWHCVHHRRINMNIINTLTESGLIIDLILSISLGCLLLLFKDDLFGTTEETDSEVNS